jgi:xanthine dehydrogenase accessory factor
MLDRLLADWREQRAAVLVTDLASGEQRLLHPEADAGAAAGLLAAAAGALLRDEAQRVESGGRSFFLQPFSPPLRMILVGAVHIAQPLAAMATLAGYAVVVVDPRQAFASEARFPDVTRIAEWPDEALAALAPDRRSAVVMLTHDPKLDEPALAVALRSPAFYVGALGSKMTHAARLERLRALGIGDEALARIHAPVGLDIGARSPAEIAVSILAEITERLRRPGP